MAQSLIAVTSLLTRGVVGGVIITLTHAAPPGMGCRSYMQPAQFLIYESDTAAGTGTLVAETVLPIYSRTGLNDNPLRTRYYRAQVKDPAGNLGALYPPIGQSGIAGTPTLDGVGPALDEQALVFDAKITNLEQEFSDETQALASRTSTLEARANNATTGFSALSARVTQEQSARVSGDNALAQSVQTVEASMGDLNADGRFEMRAGPGGSYIQAYVSQTAGGSKTASALRLNSNGDLDIDARYFRIRDRFGNSRFMFDSETGQLIIGRLQAGAINARELLVDGVVWTEAVRDNAISSGVNGALSGVRYLSSSFQTVANAPSVSNSTGRNLVIAVADYRTTKPDSTYNGTAEVVLWGGGSKLQTKTFLIDDNFSASTSFIYVHESPPASIAYRMEAMIHGGGGGGCLLDQCKIVVIPLRK